ncbi:hypothetical protein V8E51_012732 [Hyaloscypha variabilis]
MVHLKMAKTESPVKDEVPNETYLPEHSSQRKERVSKVLSGAEVAKLRKDKQTAIRAFSSTSERVIEPGIASPMQNSLSVRALETFIENAQRLIESIRASEMAMGSNVLGPMHEGASYSSARPSNDLDIFYPSKTRPEPKLAERTYPLSLEFTGEDFSDPESSDGETLSQKADKMSFSGSEDLTLKDSQREKFLGTVFKENGAFTSHSPGASTGSEGRSNSSQADPTPSSSTASRSSYLGGRGASQKRKQASDDEEEQRYPERPRKQGRPSPRQQTERKSGRGRRLACHFHLIDKQLYCKNSRTGKKYETCSGPGWYTMHHLKQHLGDSASSVHRKIRCPRCWKPFKSWKEEGKHLAGDECSGTPDRNYDCDDISDRRWDEIEKNVSRAAFEKLSVSYQNRIDTWVLDHLESYAPHDIIESRKGELRKWHMIWDILAFGRSPPPPFYMDSQETIPSNTDLLLRTFKEVVDASVENGEIEGITDDNLEKLQKCLEVAIGRATQDFKDRPNENDSSQMQDLLPENPPALSMLDPAPGTSAWNALDTQLPSQMQPFGNPFGSNPADASTSMIEGYMLDQLDDADWQQFMEETRP